MPELRGFSYTKSKEGERHWGTAAVTSRNLQAAGPAEQTQFSKESLSFDTEVVLDGYAISATSIASQKNILQLILWN